MPKFKFARRNVKTQVRKKRLKQWWRVAGVFGIVLLTILGLRYASLHIEKLKLNAILFPSALQQLKAEELIASSGVKIGDPLFAIDLVGVVEKIKENPWVASVQVKRKFPRNLWIEIQEKNPQLLLSVDQLYWVSSEAEIIQSIEKGSGNLDLPILTGFSRQEMEQDPPRSRELLKQALELARLYQAQTFAQNLGLSEIHYQKGEGFSLYPEKQNFRAVVGLDDFEVKLSRLANALEKLKALGRSVASIDLNYEGKAILTL